MRNGSPKIIYGAAEAEAYIDAIRLPTKPVEGTVATAPVSAELQRARLGQRIVWVVDADKGCT